MPVVRLLAIDLDYTLLDSDRRLPPEGMEAVREAQAAGIQVVLASGRVASGMVQYAKELGLAGALISCNGAYVVTVDGELIAESRLEPGVTRCALEFFQERGVHAHLYCDDEILLPELNCWTEVYLQRVRRANWRVAPREELRSKAAHKVIALSEPEKADILAEEARALFRAAPVAVLRSEPEYLEMISSRADKGVGLAAVADLLGVDRSETAAIGDYHNDIPMLAWAGVSAAVENAPEAVKAAADIVVSAHDSGGVREFVRYLVHNSEKSKAPFVRP